MMSRRADGALKINTSPLMILLQPNKNRREPVELCHARTVQKWAVPFFFFHFLKRAKGPCETLHFPDKVTNSSIRGQIQTPFSFISLIKPPHIRLQLEQRVHVEKKHALVGVTRGHYTSCQRLKLSQAEQTQRRRRYVKKRHFLATPRSERRSPAASTRRRAKKRAYRWVLICLVHNYIFYFLSLWQICATCRCSQAGAQ